MLALELKHQFDTHADTLELLGEGHFRVRAYRRAAMIITEISDHDLQTLTEKELEQLPGIGDAIAKKIIAYRESGTIEQFEKERHKVPPGLFDLLKIPNLGPKSIRKMWQELDVKDIDDVVKVIENGSLANLYGFGEKKVQKINEVLHLTKKSDDRIPLQQAQQIADELKNLLKKCEQVEQIEIAGSLRRQQKTIGDIDFLVASLHPAEVIDYFVSLPGVLDIIAKGTTKASVRVKNNGRQVDLRVVAPNSFGAALQYFTGSKAHNIELRKIAQQQGLKVSEYGVYRGAEQIAGNTENGVYEVLGVQMPPPEQRIGKNEFGK
jgi:DNA polymerase (family 10)